MSIGLEQEIVDRQVRDRAARQLAASGHRLPRLQDLADPHGARARMPADLASVDPDSADARNLFRVHWHNASDRRALAERRSLTLPLAREIMTEFAAGDHARQPELPTGPDPAGPDTVTKPEPTEE